MHISVPFSWKVGVTSVPPKRARNVGLLTKLLPNITSRVPGAPLGGRTSVTFTASGATKRISKLQGECQ